MSALLKIVGSETPEVLIDEFGDLDRQVKQFKPKADRHEQLKILIKSWYDNHPADKSDVLHGHSYEIQVSARRNERRIINKLKVWALLKKFLGVDRAISLWETSLDKLDASGLSDNVSAGAYQALTVKERTGYRTLTAVAKGPPQAAA